MDIPKLSNATLPLLPQSVRRPGFDRTTKPQRIIHIGVGGFHRAHQAVYLDDLLGMSREDPWLECGMGILPSDRRMRDVLESQDYLYTVMERSAQGQEARVIGSITDFVFAPESPEAAIRRLADPECRIVSLTITEGGYLRDDATGKLLEHAPGVVFDLENPSTPTTFLGYLAGALERRMQAGARPFTLMSCDNLQGNGDTLKGSLLAFCELRSPLLHRWVAENVAFPNSMVDRITPATTDPDREQVRQRLGLDDGWPVVTEPFCQWVIEDTFCYGRPALEQVGVQFTTDVHIFEVMKMSLLNGGHLAIAYISALLGYGFVHEAMRDRVIAEFLSNFLDAVTPVVQQPPGIDLNEYKASLVERFSNPTIFDQISRIASEGAAKMPKFILPSIRKLLAQGRSTELPAVVIASWIHYLKGKDERGGEITILDSALQDLQNPTVPGGVLGLKHIFGEDLSGNSQFVGQVRRALASFEQEGVVRTVSRYQKPGVAQVRGC